MARQINYGAGFLPQNLYQNLLNIQQQGLAERNRRERERASQIGGVLGQFAGMDIGRSAEAEKDFLAKRNDELARMKQGLKDIDPINAPKLYQQQLARINEFERGSQQALDRFKDSGFLGLARDRGALQLPQFERRPEGFDSAGVQQARARQQQMVGEAQGVRDRASKEFQDRGRATTESLLDAYDLGELGESQFQRQAQSRADQAQDREEAARGFLSGKERDLQTVKTAQQQQLDEALAQQAKEREGQIYNAGLGIYQDKESFAPIAEYERGFEDIKRRKLIEYDPEVGEAERAYLDASDKGALERMEKYLPEMEKIKRGLDVKRVKEMAIVERKQFVLDELAKIYQVEPEKLKADLTRDKKFNDQALIQKYEELSKLSPLQLSIAREKYQQETGLIADRTKVVGEAETAVKKQRIETLRPVEIETMRQKLATSLSSKIDEFYTLGRAERNARLNDAVEMAERLGEVKLADDLRRLGAEPEESFAEATNRNRLQSLVDELEAKSESRLDEAENMSAILNAREAGRLQVQLEANINSWEQFGRGQREEIIQQELDKAESLGDIQSLQELENIITLEPLKQKNALKAYKDRKLADIEAQSGARVREIISKAGKDITDEDIKNLSELGSSPSEKILLREFGKASKIAATRQNELNKLSLPDNVISPRRKFEIAQKELNLPATMTYENSQAKLSLITNLINSGQTPTAQMLEGVGMGGMMEEVKKVVEKKQEPFKKEALMNSLVGLVESSVAEGEDGKPDKAKQEEALNAFRALSKDADTKKLLDKYGYDESWFKGQSSVKLRAFTKELASLRQTNSQTALNLAKKSYTESQVPKLTPAQQEQAARAKEYRSTVGDLIKAQIEAEGTLDMDKLRPVFTALQMEFFPEKKEAALKEAGKAAVKGFLNRVPDGTPEMARNILNNMQINLSDEELNNLFSELKPKSKEEPKKTKDPNKVSEAEKEIEERAALTKAGRPPNTKPLAQLFWDIANTVSKYSDGLSESERLKNETLKEAYTPIPGSMGDYLTQ